jgi:sarcosine oxidase delta subunit
MNSLWELGENSGYEGADLSLHRITCPFCEERGNFEIAFRGTKKQPNNEKVLNFDTYKCGNCAGYVQVVWSASHRHHDFIVQPRSKKLEKAPEIFPEAIGRYWLQAKRNIRDKNWDAAAVMARSALQISLRAHEAKGNNLKQEIDDLAAKGLLPPLMKEWAHLVRDLGNDSAHPTIDAPATTSKDAADIVAFLDFLLEYLYVLPKKINDYRGRKDGGNGE